jgi:hypothetical protein
MYIIKEIGYCVFSVFFDANTISTSSSSGSMSENYDDLHDHGSSIQKVATTLNCFSVILPLDGKQNILVDHYGDTQLLINSFENIILEYKVYAQIRPKVNRTTAAIENLTRSIKQFCLNLNILRTRGIHPISNYDIELKHPARIHVNYSLFILALSVL